MQLLDDLRETTRCWNLKEKALVDTFWRIRTGIGYGLIARQIMSCDYVLRLCVAIMIMMIESDHSTIVAPRRVLLQ